MAFDPDAYLSAKTGGDGGFDPDAYLAKKAPKAVDPRFVDDEPPAMPFSADAQAYNQNVEDLKNTKVPTQGQIFGRDLKAIGNTFAEGARAAGTAVAHPVETIKSPERRRETLRGLDKMVTLGYGQKLAARIGNALGDTPDVALGPETFGNDMVANTQATDRAAAPGFQELGSIAGMLTPGASLQAAKGGAKIAQAATGGLKGIVPSAARGIIGYEATAPALAGLSADAEGRRLETAADVASDPTGLALAGGTSALVGAGSKLADGAKDRATAGAKAGITTGEQNAGIRKVRKLDAATGPDDVFLADLFERHPEVKKVAYVSGAAKPKTVGRVVGRVLDKTTGELDDAYDRMAAHDRLIGPEHIDKGFEKMIATALNDGDQESLGILRKERARFADEYGNFGKLSPATLRGLKRAAGKAAFPDSGIKYPPEVRAKIWGAYADAIETQAEGTPGVEPARVRQLNKDTQILMAAKDALEERTVAQAAKRKSIGQHALQTATTIGGAAAGGLPGLILGRYAGPAALRALGKAGRRIDYAVSRRPQIGEALGRAAPGARTGQLAGERE